MNASAMKPSQESQSELGEKIRSAVERICDSPEEILKVVERRRGLADGDFEKTIDGIIAHYSNRSALTGGATALPAMIPGVGTAATLLAGPAADMVLLLKFEVEMCLALAAAHGHDITDPAERQLAFLLAALKTAESGRDRSSIRDAVDVGGAALWNYSPRRVAKLLVTSLGILAAAALSRNFLKAVPFVGVAVGASMNKWLSGRVGRKAHAELVLRKELAEKPAPVADAL